MSEELAYDLGTRTLVPNAKEIRVDGVADARRAFASLPASDDPQWKSEESGRMEQAKYGVLVVDDDPVVLELLRELLESPDRIIHGATTAAEADAILLSEDISLVFLDLLLPDVDGRDLLVRLRKNVRTAGLPIFVLSAIQGNKIKTDCFARGADEFFEKPWDSSVIAAAVASKLARNGRMMRDMRRDSLTGLPNRAAFHEAFDKAAALSVRNKQALSLGIIDLDHFKHVNDRHGHPAGDAVLHAAANLLAETFRVSDYVARWGGEEFVVFFPNTDVKDANLAMTKALEAMRATPISIPGGEKITVTFSAGIALWTEFASVEETISEADRYLYIAKAAGRNRIVLSDDHAPATRKKILIGDDDELVVAVIKHRLERVGFEVIQVDSSVEILTAALDPTISMILMDVKMPGMDGFEILGRLRALPILRHIPIVMLTAMGSERDIVKGIELGADDYIVKPFSLFELLARIHRLLK
ncbi:MAG: response regulator [Candidatus Hydrogenedentota bacterium]